LHFGGTVISGSWDANFAERDEFMYAKSSDSEPYHLLTEDEDSTLCGLRVVPIIIDRPAKTTALHLTSEKPNGGSVCKKCAELKRDQESNE
jgi:hypothetical protein